MVARGIGRTRVGGEATCELPADVRPGIAMSIATPRAGLGDPGTVGQRGVGSAGHRTGSHVVGSTAAAGGVVSHVGNAVSTGDAVAQETRSTQSAMDAGKARGATAVGETAPPTSCIGGLGGAGPPVGGAGGPLPPPWLGGGPFGAGAGSSAGAQSHAQTQFQTQSSPVPSPASVEISVVVPHQVNVQSQTHDGSPELLGAGDGDVLVCVTAPSSPGLRTRIDTLTFAGPGCGMSDPRSSLFVVDDAGVELIAGGSSHVQFQIQFHVQSRELLLPVSSETD